MSENLSIACLNNIVLLIPSDVLVFAHCQILVGSIQNSSGVTALYSPTHWHTPPTHVAGYSHSSALHFSPTKLMSGSLQRPSDVGINTSMQRHTPSQNANGDIQLLFVSHGSFTLAAVNNIVPSQSSYLYIYVE